MKNSGERISMLTAYDATFAKILDTSQVDVLLVGDSLGMVTQGHENTLPVTIEDIIYHTRAVVRGTQRAHVVADMPFMSYQAGLDSAIASAGRLMKEGGAHSVKLEGGAQYCELVNRLSSVGIPVMGHLGLTPQSVHKMGGFKVQGRQEGEGKALLSDALSLEKAGAFSIVLEGIPESIAQEITQALTIPTIGIGAGAGCDGQVLVIYDLLGMNEEFRPRFVRRYEQLGTRIRTAVDAYVSDVRDGSFPSKAESFSLHKTTAAKPKTGSVSALRQVGACGTVPPADNDSSEK